MNFGAPFAPLSRALVPCGLFALVFAAVASVLSLQLRAVEGMPDMVVLSPKLDAYRARAEQYNTVFIGTSRTLYHVSPRDVEAGATEAGCPNLKVFNFGVFGLTGAEQDWLIEEVIAAGDGHLETLVLEDPLPETRHLRDVTSTRGRYFNHPAQFGDRIDSIQSFPESLPKRVFRTGILSYGMAYDLSGVGRGANLVFPDATPPPSPYFDMSEDGFEVLGSILTDDITARREEFLGNPAAFSEALDAYGISPGGSVEARAAYLVDRLNLVKQAGLRPGLFISADPGELDRTPPVGRAVKAMAPEVPVMNLNQPDIYPELFERDLWFDLSHFGEEGARRMSRQVGTELCLQMADHRERHANAVR